MEVVQCKKDSEIPRSELQLLEALRRLPPSDGCALHSIAWQGIRSNRQADGEADIVVLHAQFGVLVIEVKGGGIEIENGGWISTDASGNRHSIKDPFEQATSSKHALLRYLRQIDPSIQNRTDFAHAVAFPDVSFQNAFLSPSSPREIIFDRQDIAELANAIARTFKHWRASRGVDQSLRQRLRNLLVPTVSIRRRLSDSVADIEQRIIHLTAEQIRVSDAMRRNRRAIIFGGAGTGKTLLAVERSKCLSNAGNETLLLCFNRPLAQHLQVELEDTNVTASTFHSFCIAAFNAAGRPFAPITDIEWWGQGAATLLVDCSALINLAFDAILVDEAQDFHRSWLEALECLLSSRQDSIFIAYGDSHQLLWERGWGEWVERSQWSKFDLIENCRNTRLIGAKVAEVFSEDLHCRCPDGVPPEFHRLDVKREGVYPVIEVIRQSIEEEHIQPHQIQILTSTTEIAKRLQETSIWDLQFSSLDGSGDIKVDTIHRFKGLESALVIIVFGSEVTSLPAHQLQILKYVAYSRAKAVLHVFSPRDISL